MRSRARENGLPVAAACLALAALAAGCGGGGGPVVQGSVLLDGRPLAGAQVQLLPMPGAALGAHTATTDEDGRFTIRAEASNNPVNPGRYLAVITKPAAGPGGMRATVDEVPPVYRSQAWTPFKNLDVQPGANELPGFELRSPGKGRGAPFTALPTPPYPRAG